jgi:hypothetical protein
VARLDDGLLTNMTMELFKGSKKKNKYRELRSRKIDQFHREGMDLFSKVSNLTLYIIHGSCIVHIRACILR